MNREEILKAVAELRKFDKRKFPQTVDLIVNLKSFDIKRDNVNAVVSVPHKFKEKRICAFLNKKSGIVDTITKPEFELHKGKKAKKLAKRYDAFICLAELMPSVAAAFGKFLGPSGKMPSPQLGMIMREDEKDVKAALEKANSSMKVKSKEPSLKIPVARESMKDEEIAENVLAIYNSVAEALPRKKENIRNVLIKFTMSKPLKLAV